MNKFSFGPTDEDGGKHDPWPPQALQHLSTNKQKNLRERWYALTTPAISLPDPDRAQQERLRQSRHTSVVILLLAILTIVLGASCALLQQYYLLPLFSLQLASLCIGLIFNQRGNTTTAGILVVTGIELLIAGSLLLSGDLTGSALGIYDLLILSELAALVLLPLSSIFTIAALNSAFIAADLTLQHSAANLTMIPLLSRVEIYARPILLQIVVACVGYFWVQSLKRARARARHAEDVASLQQELVKQYHVINEEKRQLEGGLQQLVDLFHRAVTSDLSVRAPLSYNAQLRSLAVSFNTLLVRFQQAQQAEIEWQKMGPRLQRANQLEYALSVTHHEVLRLTSLARKAKAQQQPFLIGKSNSPLLDPLIIELVGNYIQPRSTQEALPRTDKVESVHQATNQRLEEMVQQLRQPTSGPLSSPGTTGPLTGGQQAYSSNHGYTTSQQIPAYQYPASGTRIPTQGSPSAHGQPGQPTSHSHAQISGHGYSTAHLAAYGQQPVQSPYITTPLPYPGRSEEQRARSHSTISSPDWLTMPLPIPENQD
ncbi:hypothetical protein [Tengunoibacter tsumagoiensis]|uniref:HAMP domain-containing protein n=1 Tax=Tengunoibacter tsumagoiensis TaxID=2014871 RepID=A0A401ZXF6_9CHLR|nr:hypothetical protein [Tengunoibacter tsumagoiensis]GCE11538.1 hypothetical protein KTT_13970 [Tengunoibacter tsumagoiensis]